MRVFSSELLTATSTTPLPYLKTVYVRRNCKKKMYFKFVRMKKNESSYRDFVEDTNTTNLKSNSK